MTPFHTPTNPLSRKDSCQTSEAALLRVLFYPNGKKREFEYDNEGMLSSIDYGDGTIWLRSDEGWIALSQEHPPEFLANIKLNQESGDLHWEAEGMRITELPSGEKLFESL